MGEKEEKTCAKIAHHIDCPRSPTWPPSIASDSPKLVVYNNEESSENEDRAIETPDTVLSRQNAGTYPTLSPLSKLRPQPHQSKCLKLFLSAHLQHNFLCRLPVVVRATMAAMTPGHNQRNDLLQIKQRRGWGNHKQ
jgi:hypothetical protein